MEITLDYLAKGKPTVIKDKPYFKTSEYVDPFIDQMSKFTNKFIVQVQTPDQVTVTDGSEDLTFNRVWIQAVLPEKYTIDNHDECYGLIYGLDVKKPVYKIYRGYLNQACTNLCVFNPDWLEVQELLPEEKFTYSITNLMEKANDFESKLKQIKNTYLENDTDSRHKFLGQMIEKALLNEYNNLSGKTKIANSTVIDAYKSVYLDSSSSYYVGDQQTTVFNYYNAFTEILRDDKKDIMQKLEKVMLINSLFGI